MVLRHRCRRLVLLSRIHTPSCCQSLKRPLHTTSLCAKEPSEEDVVPNDDSPPNPLDKIREQMSSEQQPAPGQIPGKTFVRTMTLEEIDMKMTAAELGLKKVKRAVRRNFLKWVIQEGRQFEHFPQKLVHDIEERRVEKIRKKAEDRMFARMNTFFNSLTFEEIEEGNLQEPIKKSENEQGRVSLESPTPFQKLMSTSSGSIRSKDWESKVLALLKIYDPKTHTMYRNYIEWSDYKLQKYAVEFDFRNYFHDSKDCGDLGTRLTHLSEKGPNSDDLANHFGTPIGDDTIFPSLPRFRQFYGRESPFRTNPTFKPWRPLSHKTRQQMFDAWREGLGLRNIAWLGGVSWRRVDGVIGILKREWEYVQQGGKLEHHMAEYIEGLLAMTPITERVDHKGGSSLRHSRNFLRPNVRIEDPRDLSRREQAKVDSYNDLLDPDIPLADPPLQQIPGTRIPTEPGAPNSQSPIFIQPPRPLKGFRELREYRRIISYDKKIRDWDASQKEPLVEVPIKRTKQYYAIVQEMEEYDEKRAAQALDGVGGRTLTEKEEGIKMFQRFFGGLRSLDEIEKYQGTPPWELTSEEIRRALAKQAKRAKQALQKPANQGTTASELTPADSFRLANSSDPAALTSTVVKSPKERVVWRFEDVSWVKQRTTRSRKKSWVGRLDHRAQTESGVARYGPFGIGGGIEGVGGVKQVLERGRDGLVKVGKGDREKKRTRREIVV